MGDIDKKEVDREVVVVDDAVAEEPVYPTLQESMKGKFPTWIDLLAILGLFFVAQLITAFIFMLMGWAVEPLDGVEGVTAQMQRLFEYEKGRIALLWAVIAQPMTLLFVLIYRAVRGGKSRMVRHSINGFNPTVLLRGVVMLLALVVVIEPLMQMMPDIPSPEGRGIYMILTLMLVAPLFEELLCRGVVLEAVRSRRGAWTACIVSALIFGVMHVEPQYVVNAFLIGLLLGYVYLRTNSIFAPIILHSINNLFAYMLLIFGLSDVSLLDLLGNGSIYSIVYIGAVVVLILSAIAISRRLTKLEREDRAKRKSARESKQVGNK